MTDATVSAVNARPLLPSQTMRKVAGEALSLMDVVYLDASEEWKKTDGSAAISSKGIVGVVVAGNQEETTIADGEMATVVVFGRVAGFTDLTPQAPYYVSDTAGKAGDVAGTVTRFLGWAESATVLFLEPFTEPSSA
jgi:phage tail sheath gpL-like